MNYLAAAVLGIVFVELILRLPVIDTGKALTGVTGKSLRTISSSRISDHWKEKVLLSYAGTIALNTTKLAGFFVLIFVVIFILSVAFDYIFGNTTPILEFLVTIPGIAFTTVVSLVYAKIRAGRG